MVYRTVKQPQGSYLCVAACGAMVARTSLEYAISNMDAEPGDKPWHSVPTLFDFLEPFGIYPGMVGTGPWKMQGNLALLVVESESRDDMAHLVFWDGCMVRDPNPFRVECRPLSDMTVLETIPLIDSEV